MWHYLLHLALFLSLSLKANARVSATATTKAKNVSRRTQTSLWDYTDVPYGSENPSRQLLNIALPEQGGEPYGVMLFHHAAGGTHYSVGRGQVDAAHESGYALVSWESAQGDILSSWSYAQTCFDFVRANANEYGWDPNKIIISGRSLGSIVSWKLAHSRHPAIVGIYTYNALPEQAWAQPGLWYPPDDVVAPAPLTYMVYGPGPESSDGHNPINAYPVRDKYTELGEGDKLTFIEGMWNDTNIYSNGNWINEYQTFHYLPDLVTKIEDGIAPTPTSVPTDEDAVGHPYEPFTNGANGLFIGHSFFVPIAREFDTFASMAKSRRNLFSQHEFNSEFSGGPSGSPGNLWADTGHFTTINASLSTGTIDLLGMTSYDGDEDADMQSILDTFLETGIYPSAEEHLPEYTQWIDLALSYNPDTSFFIGFHWLSYNSLMTAENFTIYNEFSCDQMYNSIVLELRQLYPDTHILYICYGPVASKMRQMFEDGNLPDVVNQIGPSSTSLFTDANRGHAGAMMKEMMGLIWLQILYEPPPQLLEQYLKRVTTWNKPNVGEILTEALAFNEAYNLKEGATI
mmetsp:Transcript_21059/g.31211  ORF Transcript_21059/g.31211 Transcript_21059/m.31211 type:complete len:572 (+) Transcript_21059:76-1791(+)|eukprot:CAMPEP_0194206636 /NCGR_PEP_ID=MMETSP0156-20130528/5601_1 /TAXON_ID=33649 /ORGANISM="Thalassionema nitzschioides, Strain L26-B" /LENGTH=571 /DNA_ID=CAMNT_0038933199 /DNA_START=55 /DNA_END=1770 /DNA_ORIENTATION=-